MAAVQKYLSVVAGVDTLTTPAVVGGAASAGQLVALNSTTGLLDPTMMPAGIGADTQALVASEAIAAGALINVWSNAGTASARNADNTSQAKAAQGYVSQAVASGGTATVYLGTGLINGLSGLTPGANYFLGTVGAVVLGSGLPTTAGTMIQQVGVATGATTLQFTPQPQINQ